MFVLEAAEAVIMNNVENILISSMAGATLVFVLLKIRKPFKQHMFNTFAYIVMLMIVFALSVRVFFFLVDKPGIAPKIQGYVETYPSINLVISSYLLSN